MKFILAIDHGTSGVKTSLFSVHGERIDTETQKTPITFLPGGGAEQDPGLWWDALITTSRKLVSKKLVPAEDIVAVCVSSTFSSTVAVDEQGKHIGNSLTWMDSRGAPYVKKLIGGFPSFEGYGLFKMLPWIYKTAGGPQLSGKDDIAHVLYWKNAAPEVYKRTKYFLGSKDYLNLRLCGQAAASFDSIALFWCANTRDINNIYYDDWIINKFGIDKSKLPPLKRSIDVLGELLPEVADAIGLPKGVKVAAGSPDHQSACMGSGAVRDFEGHFYIGTSSWIQCIVPFKKTDMFHSIASLPTSIPGKYYSVCEQDIAGGCLPFLAENILFRRNKLNSADPPGNVYPLMDEIAASVVPGSASLIFTPWLNGERTPVDSTTLRAGIYNLSMTTTSDQIIRAFFEGVAYNSKWMLEFVEKFIGRKMENLNAVGGGANSRVWCQIFADVLERNIRQVQDPQMANARGAAFIASVALGHITFEDIPGLVKFSGIFEPDPQNQKIYGSLYREFIEIYKRNKSIFKRLNG
jgi:xylulokinase